jgi:glycosyltransferase involved in cell wall biosynthesis
MREKIEGARFVFCISEFCRSQLMMLVDPAHWAKMHVIRLGVEPEVFSPSARKTEDGDPLTILCVGRLVPAKGQMILLEACRELRDKGRVFRLVLVGNGPDRKGLERFAVQHNLPVTFAGACSHAETLQRLRGADVFVLASFAEGVPVALMEAMAMEVPCVSTIIAGIPELIRGGIDGVLVSPSSVEELAEALDRLLLNRALRLELGRAGRLRVLDRYNLPENILVLGEALRKLQQS